MASQSMFLNGRRENRDRFIRRVPKTNAGATCAEKFTESKY